MKFKVNKDLESENTYRIEKMFGVLPREREIFKNPDLTFLDSTDICYITGPSGSGKSVLAEIIKDKYCYEEVTKKFDEEIPIIDALGLEFSKSLSILNMIGLSEAYIYITPYKYLSKGQKFRFDLAYFLTRGIEKIIIDEYSAYLDRETAKIISYMLQKLVRKNGIKIVVITGNDDLEEYLQPNVTIHFDDYSCITISEKNKKAIGKETNPIRKYLTIKEGTYDDLKKLEKYHYFGDVKEGTLIRRQAQYYSLYYKENLMGILVTTLPYANSVFEQDLLNINDSLRIIFRMIIHPKIRGVGGTKLLYKHVLENEKKLLYIRSAMAVEHPFLDNLGMVENQFVDYESTTKYGTVKKLVDSRVNRESTFDLAIKLLGNTMWEEYTGYNELLGFQPTLNVSFFINVVRKTFNRQTDLSLIMEVLKPIKMREYYYDNRF